MKVKVTQVVSDSLRPHGVRVLCPWNSPDENIGVGSHSLLQGIFLTQGLNPGLLHCRQILCLRHQAIPALLLLLLLLLSRVSRVQLCATP